MHLLNGSSRPAATGRSGLELYLSMQYQDKERD